MEYFFGILKKVFIYVHYSGHKLMYNKFQPRLCCEFAEGHFSPARLQWIKKTVKEARKSGDSEKFEQNEFFETFSVQYLVLVNPP